REGIVLKWVDLDLPEEQPEDIIEKYVAAFSERTKLVHLTHMINWTGQLLPVGAIGKLARARGIEVLVDGAHTFAQLPYKIQELHCDYYGTSLHKWLCAPFGSGMLWVRSEKIKALYPLFGAPQPDSSDVRKFEHLGTRSFAIEQGIGHAVEFHHMIGTDRKVKRLRYLNDYWLGNLKGLSNIQANHPENPSLRGAISNIHILGKDNAEISRELFNKYRIHTVYIKWEKIDGIRITPNVYTSLRDLDRLVDALQELAS
ncbi:MAG: aminotransferase class V-fold PLP-dependent enzyme, partial [Bacteroidota bacterium]